MHLAPDELALVAIGDGDHNSLNHVQSCLVCRSEVDSLSAVSAILADGGPVPVRAPDHVWLAIAAAIEAETQTVKSAPVITISGEPAASHRAQTQRPRRRGFSSLSLLGAAAAGAAVMWIGSMALTAQEQPNDQLVASAQLAPLVDSVDSGEAEIYERDGQRVLRLETASLPDVANGYLEVWLLGDDAAGMVTLGTLTNDGVKFVLPQGLSTDTFTTVDVSVEHYDGDPTHSGESLWRGPLASS